jgi:hypothetical protein
MTRSAALHSPAQTAMTNRAFHWLLKLIAVPFFLAVSTGAAMAAATITVEQPAGTTIADGGTKDFGSVLTGSNTSLTFTIRNTGDADLTGLGITKDAGPTANDFSITAIPSAPVAAGGSTTFTVQFTPSGSGSRTATIHIANNDPGTNKNPYDITLTGTGTAPVMVVEQPVGTNISNGGTKDFGSVLLGQSQALTFTIKNTATGPNAGSLTGLTITKSGTDAAFFSITSNPTAPVAAGSSTTFTITFSPTTTPRDFDASISIANNDPNDNPFVIALTGTGIAPDISVESPVGTPVGATAAEFGTVTTNSPLSKTFTITNTGTAPLTLGTVTSNSGNFVLKSQPSAGPIAPNGTTTFTVQFMPTSVGNFTGALSIPTNITHIASKNPYAVNLHGTGALATALEDAFGYKKADTAPAVAASFLKDTDADVFVPAGLLSDDQSLPADLGFTFFFYDQAYTRCFIGTNGIITFGSGTSDYTPDTIPSPNTPHNFIAPFWTDLDLRSAGKILYATRGTAPNRTFIVKWQDAPEFAVSGSKVTFQVLLYESTNTIEYQYQSISGFGTNHNVAAGIESRDYGTTQPQPAAGVIGIQHAYGTASSVIAFPSAVRFSRPVIFAIESKYDKPTTADPTVTTVTDTPLTSALDTSMSPPVGTTYKTPYGTVQRFDAPEFIYMNKDFAKLATAGDVNDADPLKIAWYRLVNDGYSIDGQVVQGTHTFFTTTLTHDVTVVWRWKLEHAVIISSDTGDSGFGTPAPPVGRNWYPSGTQFTAAIDSVIQNPGAGFRYRTAGYTVTDKTGTVVSPGNDPTSGPLPAAPFLYTGDAVALARRGTLPLTIIQPLRVMWNFEGQVRYRFDALNMDSATALNGQAFVRVYKPAPDRAEPDNVNYPPNGIVYSNGVNTDVWIDAGATTGRKVDVGVFYRTPDDSLTLSGFSPPPAGDLVTVTSLDPLNDDATVPNQLGQMKVARVYTVNHAKAATEVHWSYASTIYRAEVPLGLSLDALDRNSQLKPSLPAGKFLKVADTGPGNLITTRVFPPTGSTSIGDPLRWDSLGKALFPVRPGIYEVAWPDDSDPSKSYRIEILTGYPGDTVTKTVGSLNADGSRLLNGAVPISNCATVDGSNLVTTTNTGGLQVGMNVRGPNIPTGAAITTISPGANFTINMAATGTKTSQALTAWKSYENTVVLPEIDPKAGFPAQMAHAHYNYLFDTVAARQAPTKLDLSTTDEWKFQDVTYADPGTGAAASKSTAGIPFTATGAGRSVLLFSYRPNPDEIADGNLANENLAVRVVRSSPVSVIPRTDSRLVLGQRGLQLGSGAPSSGGSFGIVGPSGSVAPGSQFVIDFWLNAKGLESSSAVTLTNCTTNGTTNVTCASTAGVSAGMSISGPTIPSGAKISSVNNGTSITLSAAATAGGTGLSLTASYSSVTLTSCVTNGTTTLTCASTADVVEGMSISGTNIVPGTRIASKANATTLILTTPATGSGAGLSLTASNKPVTVLSSGSGGLKVTLDPSNSTVSASYRGLTATHPFTKARAAWRHYVIHVFKQEVFGTGVTLLDFYVDGVCQEQALPTGNLQGNADSTVSSALTSNSFRFGVDVDPLSSLQLDQFRLFTFPDFPADDSSYLTPGEILDLKTKQDMTIPATTVASVTGPTQFVLSAPATGSGAALTLTVGNTAVTGCSTVAGSAIVTCPSTTGVASGAIVTGNNVVAGTRLRGYSPSLWYSFEAAPSGGAFANRGTAANTGVGPIIGAPPFTGVWVVVDLQEVATRIDCTLDNAGFGGSGFIRNEISNYNAELYTRNAEVGTWGPIFPVNHSQLYTDALRKLQVVYYENPYLIDRVPHPNVAWPYVATEYNEVTFPAVGPQKNNAIYIASRIGSEGVDQVGRPQKVFDLAKYSGLEIYQQPNNALAGYNPNEEHALTAPSGRAALKVKNLGEALQNNPPLAAFALQKDINNKPAGTYTSDPWVLVQVNNLETGEPEMAAYQVFDKRTGTIPFPRPADAQVGGATGLAYEAAATPEARFLTLAGGTNFNFSYQFDYPVFAGDLLVPPYPLNLVIGNVSLADERGGNVQVNGMNQRTLWVDVGGHAWIVSGGGRFFNQFFYPMRADFYMPGAEIGRPIAWLPAGRTTIAQFLGDNRPGSPELDDDPKPLKVMYSSAWRTDYPKLKRGETLTYQGGEYFNENPGSEGLPAVVAMQAAEIVYDSATPSMVPAAPTQTELENASARIIRPLDRREVPFTNAQMIAAGLKPGDPATSKVIVVAERWYFKELTGSLQKRFYFDSLAETLVFRGRLNDKEGGDPNLTQGPDPINVLEPNILTLDEYRKTAPAKGVYDLATTADWQTAINSIFELSQSPNGLAGFATSLTNPMFLQGIKPVPVDPGIQAVLRILQRFYQPDLSNFVTQVFPFVQLDSFGVGSALVPNASLLTMNPSGPLYVTVAENNRAELNGAPVSLHIIEIVPDRYRGAIKVIEGSDAFSEKITLQHNGEFGANTGNLNYEWWIRDSRELDNTLKSEIDSLATALPNPNWQLYKAGPGLHTIVFEGRPDVVLADKLVLVRYRHRNETAGWRVVPFELPTGTTPSIAWRPGNSTLTAPFQWAGAANSPQLQADGSKRYIPQLVMGWVKRILDRINPYEARYTDFFSNESPASYTSMIQIIGGPYAGNVALNPDKNVIEHTGLLELYRTVLDRAISLSIGNSSNGNATDGINQALLLAATRLSIFYELLAREAYSDAQDPTISVPDDSGLANVASFTYAFQNLEPDLLHEELSLLRGTDFRKSYPVYNRMFWNYAKGLGEAAYNVNYNIYDVNTDGFINEDDARLLYPQGHGDAWGHFLSASQMHYLLLQHPNFSWKARAELYSLMQNVLPVDYLDEKTFAKIAAGKARAGRDIVRATYRLNYSNDPDGQWQGYTDNADKARAWGVSEWAHRAGQSAYFDWAVANAILPENAVDPATGQPLQNLSQIERSAAESEIGEIAGGLHEIQVAMDEANGGVNPLGFDSDAITFDLNQEFYQNNSGGDRRSHFEQVYERAVTAGLNAVSVLQFATQANNKLRAIANDTQASIVDSLRQDLDYRNRLIEIFGTPYTGQIGFGKAYPEGYQGPDTMLYAYLDKTKIDQIVPSNASSSTNVVTFTTINTTGTGMMNNSTLMDIYKKASAGGNIVNDFKTYVGNSLYGPETASGPFTAPYKTASKYGFQAPADWGQRTSYGKVQTALGEMLSAEIELDSAIADYIGFLQDYEQKLRNLQSELELFDKKDGKDSAIVGTRASINTAKVVADGIITGFQIAEDLTGATFGAVVEAVPRNIGFSNDVLAPARGATLAAAIAAKAPLSIAKQVVEIGKEAADLISEEVIASLERDKGFVDEVGTIQGLVAELEYHSGGDQPKRDAIGMAAQELELKRQEYFTALSEGFRLLREREAFNKVLAANTQKNRYQDMIFRLVRNESMSKYQSAFNNAARYAWLAARAYDYETSLEPGDPAAPGELFNKIVQERQLGLWGDGPVSGQGGLAEILSQMNANFQALKGHLGIENPQLAIEKISLRSEFFRVGPTLDPEIQAVVDIPPEDRTAVQRTLIEDNQDAINAAAASAARLQDALKARIVPDLNQVPEFVRYCRPFSTPDEGPQPGIVIRFSTEINNGVNVFGKGLVAGDHKYSNANFATKLRAFGVWLADYNAAGLVISPRAYLVPIGNDYLRTSSGAQPMIRAWSVKEQRIPIPYVINQGQVSSPSYIPTLNGVDGSFGDLRRHGDFRMYHDNGDPEADDSELIYDNRLVGRSVWNSEWMLVIPGANLAPDPMEGVTKFTETVTDIKLYFDTYSHQGR